MDRLGEAELPTYEKVEIRPKKTLWDWLQLLIVPLALAVVGFWFTVQQDARQQEIEDQRARQAQKIENQRAEAERTIQQQNAQEEALQAYLDQMSMLLLEKDLRDSDEDSEVRLLARARTLTILKRLDPDGKKQVIGFLIEAELISSNHGKDHIIRLAGADLSGANLSLANLSLANLTNADLTSADLTNADLYSADLTFAKLMDAELGGANLSNANVVWADLTGADVAGVNLSNANLRAADLHRVDLFQANLTGADLTWAEGVTNEELEQQAKSLEGATMPNGQKYEDWLKDKEGRGEDGENPGPS